MPLQLAILVEEPAAGEAVDLATALAHEATALGVPAEVGYGAAPAPARGCVHVLVAPRDGATREVDRELLARCILVGLSRPGTTAYDETVRLALDAGAVFEAHAATVRAMRHLGVAVDHLPIGGSPAWDRPAPARRDLDLVVVDPFSHRRAVALAAYADLLWRFRVAIRLTDDLDEPSDAPALFARARACVLLHDAEWAYFPWLRAAQAMGAGCAVVAEAASDAAPARAGEHFVAARREALGLAAAALLEDGPRLDAVAGAGRALVSSGLRLRGAAERLLAVASRLDQAQAAAAPASRPVRREPRRPAVPPPPASTRDPAVSALRRQLKEARLEALALRRRLAREELVRAGEDPDAVATVARTPAYGEVSPRVSVIVPVFEDAVHVVEALDSVAASDAVPLEVVVVDDGSRDGTGATLRAWVERAPDVPALVLAHRSNRGLPRARNTALAAARAPLVFALDSDNAVFPPAIARLAEALDADPAAAFAYPIQQMHGGGGALGLRSFRAWDPRRLRHENPVDAMALVRAEPLRAVGGWTTDPRLHGWEDYDLWCAFAARGLSGRLVPEVLGRYRVGDASMLSITDLSTTTAYEALAERHPAVMGGVEPPL